MKKLILLAVMVFITMFSGYSQKAFPIPNKEVMQWAAGDTLDWKLSGDSIKVTTTKDYVSFNKDLKVKGDSIPAKTKVLGWITDSLAANLAPYIDSTRTKTLISDTANVLRDSIAIMRDSVDVLRANFSNYTTTANLTDSLDTRLATYIDSTTVLTRMSDSTALCAKLATTQTITGTTDFTGTALQADTTNLGMGVLI